MGNFVIRFTNAVFQRQSFRTQRSKEEWSGGLKHP